MVFFFEGLIGLCGYWCGCSGRDRLGLVLLVGLVLCDRWVGGLIVVGWVVVMLGLVNVDFW